MTPEAIFNKLQPIIAVYLPEDVAVNHITLESDLARELNINSAYFVDIVLDIEDEFGIEVKNDDLERFETVNDAIMLIQSKVSDQ